MKPKITVYTIDPCPYCDAAKRLLARRGFAYEEVLVDRGDDRMRDELRAKSGMRTFPQIFIGEGAGERLIGGYTELEKLDREVGLEKAFA